MCGIAGIHIKDPSKGLAPKVLDNLVDHMLLGIENRGTDATGLVAVTDGGKKVVMDKKDIEASEFIKTRPKLGDVEAIRTVLLHTRFATQGHQSNNANNHPVLYKTCFATHNGHISNDSELFKEFDLRRNAEVDSEIIPALFSHFSLEQAHRALQELEGNLAVAVIDPIQAPDKLILAKGNSSPLIFFENAQFIIWASTLLTLKDAWGHSLGTPPKANKFWELQEGGLLLIEGGKSELLSFKVKERSYMSSWRSSYSTKPWWDDDYHTGSYQTDIKLSEACASCGCTKFWHGTPTYTGVCMNKPRELEGGICRCMKFVPSKVLENEPDDTLFKCVTCDEQYTMFQLEQVWAPDGWMCEACIYGSDTVDDNGRIPSTVESNSGISPTALSLVPILEAPSDEGGFPDVTCGVRVFADDVEGESATPGIWVPADGPMGNEERHIAILSALATETNFSIQFIEWILFKAPLGIVEDEPWLSQVRDELDDAYADKEEEFNDLEATVYAQRKLVLV